MIYLLNHAQKKKIKRYENIIGIKALDTETLEERRFRVKIANNEQLPYSFRIFVKKLNSICGENGYVMEVTSNKVTIKVKLNQKSMFKSVQEFAEAVIPLNMILDVDYLYNKYEVLNKFTYEHLKNYTYEQLRNEVLT